MTRKPTHTESPGPESAGHTDTLPARLRLLMGQQNIGHRLLSEKAGVGSESVRNILRGRAERPRLDTLTKIAGALRVSVSELTGESPAPPPPAVRPPPVRRSMLRMHAEQPVDESPHEPWAPDDDTWGLPGVPPAGLCDVESADLRPVEGRGSDLLDPARRRGVARLPLEFVSASGAEADGVVLCRAPGEGFPPDLAAGAWILVDADQVQPARGLYLLHDGTGYLLARLQPKPSVNGTRILAYFADGGCTEMTGFTVAGRVVGRWAAM